MIGDWVFKIIWSLYFEFWNLIESEGVDNYAWR